MILKSVVVLIIGLTLGIQLLLLMANAVLWNGADAARLYVRPTFSNGSNRG